MPRSHPVPPATLARLGAICLGLPEAVEAQAWTGVRWMIGRKNFAQAVVIADGWPPAYAAAAGHAGPLQVLTFRLPLAQARAPRYRRWPFFRPPWFADIVGLALDEDTDWDEVAELLTASYRALAPKRLAMQVDGAG